MKKILKNISLITLGALIVSCETENENITVDLGNGNLTTSSIEIPVSAITNVIDTVQTDELNLLIPIGTSSSTSFGTIISSFAAAVDYTGTYGSSFGDNAVIQSVKLSVPIYTETLTDTEYNTLLNDSSKTTLVSGVNRADVDTLVTQYTVDSIFIKWYILTYITMHIAKM